MDKAEARRFLEDLDFCMTHFVKMEKKKGSSKMLCPSCESARELAESAKIEQAVGILRGDDPLPPQDIEAWIPCQPGKLPPHGERVYFLSVGFVETQGRAGGKERFIAGQPKFWRKK